MFMTIVVVLEDTTQFDSSVLEETTQFDSYVLKTLRCSTAVD